MNETVGGYRVGAGRKSQWRSPTKMMRLPAVYESEIVAIARRMDAGEAIDDAPQLGQTFTQTELDEAIAWVLVRVPPSNRAATAKLFKKLAARIGEP